MLNSTADDLTVSSPTLLRSAAASPLPTVDLHHSHISPRSIELVTEALKSGWVSEGPLVDRFERQLNSMLGLTNPVAVNSGTSALHLALAVAEVGPGDEVILPAQTFVATGLVVIMQGATPVFADIDPTTGNISPSSIETKITPRTKAIIIVHFGGYPCELDEINALAARHGVAVVEDAAHALGAVYRGRPVGAISRFTCFSFQAIKHLTTGDGGLLSCLDQTDATSARRRRWFGIDRRRDLPSSLGERVYHLTELGFKYHMNDLSAAVGIGNLENFAARLSRRQQIGTYYRDRLGATPGLNLLDVRDDRTHAYWLFSVLVERRENFIRKLAEAGVSASVVHQRIDRHSLFGGRHEDLAGQAVFDERHIAIPVHEALSDDDVDRIVKAIRTGW